MKILLWAPFGAGEHYWGPGQSAFNLYSNLQDRDIQLSIAHGYKDHKTYDLYNEQFLISNLEKNNRVSLLRFLYQSKKWIKKNACKYDVAHVLTDHHPAFLPAVWLQDAGVKTFIKIAGSRGNMVHNSFVSKLSGVYGYMLKRKNDLSGYIVISSRIYRELIDLGIDKEKIHYIPNGVDTRRFKPVSDNRKKELREKLGLKNAYTVLFTGGITTRKNPSLIAEAFTCFKNDPAIQLLLVGPDRVNRDERNRIEEIVRKHSLRNVTLLTFQKRIEEYYQAADLFVLPSGNEGLSNSLLEAQACGLPALVTKISGSEDLIKDGYNGYFIDFDKNDIYEKMNHLYKNEPVRKILQVNACEKIMTEYKSEYILKNYLKVFSEINKK